MENAKNLTIACPSCGKSQAWDPQNPHRPFCSKRCKLIDLGDWADESHRIPGEKIDDQQDPDDVNEEK